MTRTAVDKPLAADASYTHAAPHTTAAALPKRHEHNLPSPGGNDRGDDGHLSSSQYARRCGGLVDHLTPNIVQLNFHHPLEKWLAHPSVRRLLGVLSHGDRRGQTALQRIITSYRNPDAPLSRRMKYWLFHLFIDRMRGRTDVETFRKRLANHAATVRGLVIVARSLSEFGLTVPQKFSAPLFAVWNFTNRCNLACKHCYQDSERHPMDDELALEEKLEVVDQIGRSYMPMLALSGGEPTICPDLIPVLRRAAKYHIHITLATNGTTMTPRLAGQLAHAGLRYVEISLDSVDPDRHDAFRGLPGMWQKAVNGAKSVVATEGLRLGVAMCVHQGNIDEVPQMIQFAEDLGADCFAHFNFIPVGRGLKMISSDITPEQRERLLVLLNEKMQAGGMGVISTAPQLGRVCLAESLVDIGRTTCSHAGSGSGVKARVVAKYLGGCGAGRTYICIEPNGNVTPCVYLPHRVMGNVRNKPLISLFRNNIFRDVLNDRSKRLHHCGVCAFRNYCGGCRARADAYFGQLHAGDPGCTFNDKHWQRLVEDGTAVANTSEAPQDMQLSPIRHGLA